MGKKIIFLPFINGDTDTADGRKWKKDLEKLFLEHNEDLTNEINHIRSQKEINAEYKNNIQRYYEDLHAKKSERQKKWFEYLLNETAGLFEKKLQDVSKKEGFKESIVVAALPEFFWHDINDNHKHEDRKDEKNYIVGYHKPLYHHNLINVLYPDSNPLRKLTLLYRNLIFFAGTAMWKFINPSDHKDEKIYNTLFIYHGGKIADAWSKQVFSKIDGFYSEGSKRNTDPDVKPEDTLPKLIKDKKGELLLKYGFIPLTDFNGVKFAYDICVDFGLTKPDKNKYPPLSSILCKNENVDVNVLISAGMPLSNGDLAQIKAPVILRCDGSHSPYGEIAPRGVYNASNSKAIRGGMVIGEMETDI